MFKIKKHEALQWAITGVQLVIIATLESKAAIGAYNSVPHDGIALWGVPLAALQHSSLSLGCALLAFWAFGLAGRLKEEGRTEPGRVFATRVLALVLLAVPVGYLGSALKVDRMAVERTAYLASDAYEEDLALVADREADRYEREAARERIQPSVTAHLSIFDGEWWMALFFQLLVIAASDLMRVPNPLSPEEQLAEKRREAGRKGAAAAAKNRAERLKLVQGGKA